MDSRTYGLLYVGLGLPDFQSRNTGDFFTIAAIGVGAQSTLGEDIFARKYMHEKLTKMPEFLMKSLFAQKLTKFPKFYIIYARKN